MVYAGISMYACLCMCMYGGTQAYANMCMWRPPEVVFLITLCFFESGSLNGPGVQGLARLAEHWAQRNHISLPTVSSFDMNVEDPNSGPHSCMVRMLPIEQSPQSLISFLNLHLVSIFLRLALLMNKEQQRAKYSGVSLVRVIRSIPVPLWRRWRAAVRHRRIAVFQL